MKKLLSSFLATTILFGIASTSISATYADSFSDTAGHFSMTYAQTLHDRCGIIGFKDGNGTILGLFKPDNAISRAELIQMLYQCKGHQESSIHYDFKDVESTAWFATAVDYGSSLGWIQGYGDGTFRPYNPINRAEAIKMITASIETDLPAYPFTDEFQDVAYNDWFAPYISFARYHGFIEGRRPGYFEPGANLTRGEAAKLITMIYYFPRMSFNPNTNADVTLTQLCPIFPADNPWNTDISNAPIHANSANYIASINKGKQYLHADFGSNPDYGIPVTTIRGNQPKVPISAYYADETDPGPYPIPDNAKIEAGGDKHVIVLDKDNCKLYEMFDSTKTENGWEIGSGAVFDLKSNILRPDYWTSADAAGLPIFPGLVRYEELQSGKITHALRFTVSKTQKGFIHPATHFASSSTDANLPPMGLRLRLKKDFDTSGYTGHSRIILEALKTYGMIVADNGSDWFISGETDVRWNDDDLNQLKSVPGSAFEAVDTGPIIK